MFDEETWAMWKLHRLLNLRRTGERWKSPALHSEGKKSITGGREDLNGSRPKSGMDTAERKRAATGLWPEPFIRKKTNPDKFECSDCKQITC